MATLNKKVTSVSGKTHEGAVARKQSPERELERSVLACLLWEDTFYESGKSIAERIATNVSKVSGETVANIAHKARNQMYLRHVPLLLAREMARNDSQKMYVRETLNSVIQRADELTEFVSIYWKDKKQPLSAQVKKGLADAFTKFSEYDLAKYNRDTEVKLRDVLFLSHAKPKNDEQAAVWKRLIDGTLTTPDTWEVAISAAKGNPEKTREEWRRLLTERKLGGLALLRNLRNMQAAGVEEKLIKDAINANQFKMVLPFRFIAAMKYAPNLSATLEDAMLRACTTLPKLEGETVILVDVSGSMGGTLSAKSDLSRCEAASALAILVREIAEDAKVIAFDNSTHVIPTHFRGFALQKEIMRHFGGGTSTGAAVTKARSYKPDRIICITDEQSHDTVGAPGCLGYMVNVASYKPSIAYGDWTSLTGFSENLVRYIVESEREL